MTSFLQYLQYQWRCLGILIWVGSKKTWLGLKSSNVNIESNHGLSSSSAIDREVGLDKFQHIPWEETHEKLDRVKSVLLMFLSWATLTWNPSGIWWGVSLSSCNRPLRHSLACSQQLKSHTRQWHHKTAGRASGSCDDYNVRQAYISCWSGGMEQAHIC